jgi:hypothetical protein
MTAAAEEGAEEAEADADNEELAQAIESDLAMRLFIIKYYAHADIDGRIMCQNMDLLFHWAKTGTVPEQPSRRGK